MALLDDIRHYWDDDAATYDDAPQHRPRSPMVQAAWTAAIEDLLPPAPARVLDCGAGTGFLSLIAARLGHRVTALDLAPSMVERLQAKADAEGLAIEAVVGSATDPPAAGPPAAGLQGQAGRQGEAGAGPGYDAIIERHLLWTLPDPAGALAAWRHAASAVGRLVLVESLWGTVDPFERWRSDARHLMRRLHKLPPEHHAEYSPELRRSLPLGAGTHPARLVELASGAGWRTPRLRRLADVEWAERCELAPAQRLVGVTPRFALVAG
jgi:SAM-dependent methyltransferase